MDLNEVFITVDDIQLSYLWAKDHGLDYTQDKSKLQEESTKLFKDVSHSCFVCDYLRYNEDEEIVLETYLDNLSDTEEIDYEEEEEEEEIDYEERNPFNSPIASKRNLICPPAPKRVKFSHPNFT